MHRSILNPHPPSAWIAPISIARMLRLYRPTAESQGESAARGDILRLSEQALDIGRADKHNGEGLGIGLRQEPMGACSKAL